MKTMRQSGRAVRSIAAVMVVVWVAAQFLCAACCASGKAPQNSAVASKPACHQSSDCGSRAAGDGDMPLACVTFKNSNFDSKTAAIVLPEFVHFVAVIVVSSVDSNDRDSQALIERQLWPDDRVNTLEVCLGPAARSLAPPVFA